MISGVVLAAGQGSRLAGVSDVPKWLLPVRDASPTCPAECQLDALVAAGAERVHVVVGEQAAPIEAAAAAWRDHLDIELVPNAHARSRNNWYSLLLGLERAVHRGADPVLVLNSDLYAPTDWLADLLARLVADEAGAALAVDPAGGAHDEAMKVAVRAAGAVERIGKVGITEPAGEYIGAAKWGAAAARGLCAVLRSFEGREACADHWYEHAIDRQLVDGAEYATVATVDSTWVEIDDATDVDAARALRFS